MQKILSFLFVFGALNSIAQNSDSIQTVSKLLGEWELYSAIKINQKGKGNDTLIINKDSVYWNVILTIEPDSAQELMVPTSLRKDLPTFKEKCKWSIDIEGKRTWISIPCSKSIKGDSELILVSDKELHIWFEHDVGTFLVIYKRIF